MQQYLDLVRDILENGRDNLDRTGVGTRSVFGRQMRFDLAKGRIPLLTTKRVPLKHNFIELMWMLSGDTNARTLQQQGVTIWDEWALKTDHVIKSRAMYDHERVEWLAKAQDTTCRVLIDQHLGNLPYAEGCKWLDDQGVPTQKAVESIEAGELGPVYGKQFRDFEGVDQYLVLLDGLKTNPFSRRHVINLWNPRVLPDPKLSHAENIQQGRAVLPACHTLVQFYVDTATRQERIWHLEYKMLVNQAQGAIDYIDELLAADPKAKPDWDWLLEQHQIPKHRLSCQLYQRSADVFLGLPWNMTFYSLLTHLIAHEVGFIPGEFVHTLGDAHIYHNHFDAVETQLTRTPSDTQPYIVLNPSKRCVLDFKWEDLDLVDYKPQPAIKAPVAI